MGGACLHVLRGHADAVLCVAFGNAPGSRLLASGGDDTKIMLWDWHSGLADGGMAPGHTKTVWSCTFTNDDHLLCSAALAPEVLVWDVRTRQVLRRLVGHQNAAVHRVSFCGPRRLLSCGRDHSVVLWDLESV